MSRIREVEHYNDPHTGEKVRRAVVRLGDEPLVPTRGLGQPLTSAASYSQERRRAVEEAKAGRVPVGFSEAPDPQKMAVIANQLEAQRAQSMPRPNFQSLKDEVRKGMSTHTPPLSPQVEQPPVQAMPRPEMPQRPKSLRQAREEARQRRAEAPQPEILQQLRQQFQVSEEDANILQSAKAPEGREPEELQDIAEDRLAQAESELIQPDQIPDLTPDYEQLDVLRKHLMTPERKRVIENRLQPMDLGSMISRNEVRQEITIVPGQFSIVLKSMQHYEIQYCLRRMYELTGSSIYITDMLNMYKLVCCLEEVNEAQLPSHRMGVGLDEHVDNEAFDLKFKVISRFATPVLADISVQFDWFIERLHQLMGVEAVKNG